jgi:hypothetical protein
MDRDLADIVEGYLASRPGTFTRAEKDGRFVFEVAVGCDLGVDVGDSRRFVTGDLRGVEDAQALNFAHPLVGAAIAHAKSWGGGILELSLPPDADGDVAALAGQSGVLALARVDYSGFEPVQRLVAAGILNRNPLDPALAARLSRLRAKPGAAVDVAPDPQLLADVMDEAAFVDQQDVEQAEQKHFEQAIGQLERFVEDKVLVCRRDRTGIAEKLQAARLRRDGIVGAAARERVEAEIVQLAEKDEALERRIEALESREDEVYLKWRDQYHARRYQPPAVTPLFQVTFRIVPPATETSC